jgi:hypothetical protein
MTRVNSHQVHFPSGLVLVVFVTVLALGVLRYIWKPLAGVAPEAFAMLFAMAVALVLLLWKCTARLVDYANYAIHSDSIKDLRADMVDLKATLLLRKAQNKNYDKDVANNCDTLLEKAGETTADKRKAGEINEGWRNFIQARLQSLYLLENTSPQVRNLAVQTLSRSGRTLDPSRLATVKSYLEEPNHAGQLKQNLTVDDLFSANSILEEYVNDRFDNLDRAAWQLYILSAAALLCTVALALALPSLSAFEPSYLQDDRLLVPVIVIVGALGGATGGFFSVLRLFRTRNVVTYEQTMSSWMIAIRPLIGAVFALVASLLLLSGLLSLGKVTLELLLSVSFVAGFSEHFVIDIVARIAKDTPAKEQ